MDLEDGKRVFGVEEILRAATLLNDVQEAVHELPETEKSRESALMAMHLVLAQAYLVQMAHELQRGAKFDEALRVCIAKVKEPDAGR